MKAFLGSHVLFHLLERREWWGKIIIKQQSLYLNVYEVGVSCKIFACRLGIPGKVVTPLYWEVALRSSSVTGVLVLGSHDGHCEHHVVTGGLSSQPLGWLSAV